MHTRNALAFLVTGALAIAGCDRFNAKEGSSSRPSESMTNTNATVETTKFGSFAQAENASQIKRFPDETSLAPMTTQLVSEPTTVRTMPESRDVVAIIANPEDVTALAKEHGYYLVLFDNPKDTTKKLAGWVYKDAVEARTGMTATHAPHISCKEGEAHVLTDREFCATPCVADSECSPSEGVCDGIGKVAMGTHAVREGRYCIAGGIH